MASNTSTVSPVVPAGGFDPASPNTTYVQADPSTFRAVVQKLTGATEDPSTQKLPVTLPSRLANKLPAPAADNMGPRKSSTFKLHERRQKKLEINLTHGGASSSSSSTAYSWQRSFAGFGGELLLVSPVSPLDLLCKGSPRTPRSPEEEEERAIAEKGFYLHPSPLSTPRGSEPELLPLFPLHSPRHHDSSSA
ncbi:hypothetical protein L1049_004467 [Liquidambar formosana]|uniref:VQ domain-containing protein n=1 Tax=Liquidambar formosana TaxID=63359 RepID=A0AAP0RN90_LIQFO